MNMHIFAVMRSSNTICGLLIYYSYFGPDSYIWDVSAALAMFVAFNNSTCYGFAGNTERACSFYKSSLVIVADFIEIVLTFIVSDIVSNT